MQYRNGGQISTYIKEPVYDKKLRTHTFCHSIDYGYTIYGATLCSGMSLKWLKDKILRIDDFDQLSQMAGEIAPGSEGLIYLPYLTGERTPHMDPCAKGMFAGLTLGHDRRHIVRAVMEGVTMSLRDSLTIFRELGIKCDTMIASGGGAKSHEWLQMQADIFHKKVIVCEVNEQACLGACILAGRDAVFSIPPNRRRNGLCHSGIRFMNRILKMKSYTMNSTKDSGLFTGTTRNGW